MLLSTRISLFSRSLFFDVRKASLINLIGRQAHITNNMKRSHQLPFFISYEFCSKNAQNQKKEERIELSQSDEKDKAVQANATPEIDGNNKSVIAQDADLSQVEFKEGFQKDGNPKNFEELVQSRFYVDKTLFIKDFIHDVPWIIITRPRRFGKSMIIKMIQSYFHPKGTQRRIKQTETNDKQNSEHSDIDNGIFKKLKIAKSDIDHRKYYQKYPCIFFEFLTAEIEDGDMYGSLRNSIEIAFQRFSFIYDDYYQRYTKNELNNRDINYMINFEIYMDAKKQKIQKDYITTSLNFLVDQVSYYYQSDVILLIDEYDMLLNTAFTKCKEQKDFEELCGVYSDMIKIATKGKENVYKTIMIGILNFVKGVSFSGLNHFFVYPIENICFSQYFGISQQDLDDICNKIFDEKKSEQGSLDYFKYLLKYWYNGYQISDYLMYNPFSIVNCLTNFFQNRNQYCFQAYWNNSGDPKLIIHYLEKLEDSKLIKDLITLNERNCGRLDQQIEFYSQIRNEQQTIKFLFDQGYLTQKSKEAGVYIVPNYETKMSLIDQFTNIVLNIETSKLVSMETIKKLAENVVNIIEFQKLVEEKILKKISNQDKSESFFQALLFGINMIPVLNQTKNILHPQHELRTNYGKFIDSIFLPCQGEENAPEVGIVQEYKKSNEDDADTLLTTAIWQILARGYLNHLLFMIEEENSNFKLKSIIIRATVFYQNIKKNKRFTWSMKVSEYVYSVEEAKKINDLFTKKGSQNERELLLNHDALVYDKDQARENFLSNIGDQKVKLIEDLRTSLQNQIKEKQEKQEKQKKQIYKPRKKMNK